ncbi:LolA-like protein [Streptomyces siamensis]|uniref:Lipoprotein n=1 Tax=Streptomyces siamensis TaxID=1274986 RepID=A0ABP9IYV0_9ACTN
MRRTALAALCLAAAATAGLTGCLPGETKADSKPKGPFTGLTGGEIADRAVKATTGATSLRMKGDIPDDEDGGTIRIDMALDKKGRCAGTMSMNGQGKADLIKTGDTIYMKYDEKFLRAQGEGQSKSETDGVVELLADKWTKMAATGSDAKDIAGFCDLDSVLAGAEDVNSDATRGKTTTVDGSPAIILHEKDGKDRYTLYVATEGKPYLLRVDSTSAKDPGTITFSDYDKPVPAQKPAGRILDLDKLSG